MLRGLLAAEKRGSTLGGAPKKGIREAISLTPIRFIAGDLPKGVRN
jgi:hypothetical protein